MSIFGSFLVLLLILVEAAPPTASSVPKLGNQFCFNFSIHLWKDSCSSKTVISFLFLNAGLYYCYNMVIIMMSIFLSTLVVNVSRGADGGRTVPKWLKIVSIIFRIVTQLFLKWNSTVKLLHYLCQNN